MIRNESFRRKVIYIAAMIPILIALAFLGLPATGKLGDEGFRSGGKLARLRTTHELSQANLGDIDPASETMKFATLGLRPVAANILWDRANHYKKVEAWDAFAATLNQISKLQPNFISVWEFQAHNMSYNVSVEFDDYRQRYHWVKKGIGYLLIGSQFNKKEYKLPWNLGWFIGQKIGRADERVQFRRMFRVDEDFHKEIGEYVAMESREAMGPDNLHPDNWKVARLWYLVGLSRIDENSEKTSDLNLWHKTRGRLGGQTEDESKSRRSDLLLQVDPVMSLINYAGNIQEEGRVGEVAREAWRQADRSLEEFGHKPVRSSWGQTLFLYSAEETDKKLKDLARELDELAPGERQRLYDERLAKLSDAQREALNLSPSELNAENSGMYAEALEKTKVSHAEVAAFAPAAMQIKARRIVGQIADLEVYVQRVRQYRSQVNYDYWKTRCTAEQSDECVRARRLMYEAHELYKKADLQGARDAYEAAWTDWDKVIDAHPALLDSVTSQDLVQPLRRYKVLIGQMGDEFPKDFKLQRVQDVIDRRSGGAPKPAVKKEPEATEKPEPKPDEPKPGDAKPEEKKPVDKKPEDPKPAEKDPPKEDKPAEPKQAETKPAEPATP